MPVIWGTQPWSALYEYGKEVYTPDNKPALTIRSTDAGIENQVSGITFAVTDNRGHMRNEVNAVLDDFRETVRAQNPLGGQCADPSDRNEGKSGD